MRPISEATCPDLRSSVAATERAALLVRMVAIQTSTGSAIVSDGQIVHLPPDVLREELRNQNKSERT